MGLTRVHRIALGFSWILVGACSRSPSAADSGKSAPAIASIPPSVPTSPTISRPAPVHPKTALVLKGKNEKQLDVFRLGSSTPLGFKVSSSNAGIEQIGDDHPKLSPDGRWLAYGMSGRLWLAAVDGSQAPQQITTFKKGGVSLLLSGWSPDGQSLLFNQAAPQGEDPSPMAPGVSEGFYLLSLRDKQAHYLPELKGFDLWDSDSHHVFYQRNKTKGYEIIRASVEGGPLAVVQETSDSSGFGQLAPCGNDLIYVLKSRISRSKPDGSGQRHIAPQGAFADYQWPRCSPDSRNVVYQHNTKSAPNSDMAVEVAIGGSGERNSVKSLDQCKGGCSQIAWESPTSILLLDAGSVRRLSLNGSKETVATAVVDLILAAP